MKVRVIGVPSAWGTLELGARHTPARLREAGLARFKIMERKLFWGIMTPSGILALVLGTWLWLGYGFDGGWLYTKLFLTLILIAYHAWCGKILFDFKHDRNTKSHVWYRWFNEFPVLILLAAIILVVLKPF